MYIKKYWGNFIGGSDDSLNLVAFLEDQKKEEIPLSEIFAKIGLDKQNWDFRQTVEYLEFTHSDGVEMDFHFAIDVVTDLAAILLECSVSGSVNLQDLDEYNTPARRIRITVTPEEHDAMNKSLADFAQNPLEYDLSEMMDNEEIQEMARDVEALRKELYEAAGRNRDYHVKAEDVKSLLPDWKGADGCIATNRITVEGRKVGYCYREEPDGGWDSGWRFTAGDESDEYMDDPNNAGIYKLNTICNDDPDIIPLLNTPAPCAFERDENGVFQQIKDWKPDEDEEDPDMDILKQCQKWHEEDKHQKIVDALEAISAEERTPEMDMELARAYNNLADSSEPEGRKLLHQALELMQSHEEELGDTYSWNFRMGYAYYYLDQEGRALRHFEKALELHPGDDPKLNTRQDMEELIDSCKKGISLPQDGETIGFSADDKHTITRSPGISLPEEQMTLKIGYEPIKGDPEDDSCDHSDNDDTQDEEEFSNPEVYTEEEMEAVEEHIEQYFGKFENVFHELVSPDIHVDICVVPPSEERDYCTLVTMGMGAHRMNVPEELAEYKLERAELAIALPADWKLDQESMKDEKWYWPIRLLKSLARLPIASDTWLGFGHTMDNKENFAENTKLCAAILTGPQSTEEGGEVCTLPGGEEVNFYQVIPLYEDELDYKLEHDADALLDKMAGISFVVNPTRQDAITRGTLSNDDFDGEMDDASYHIESIEEKELPIDPINAYNHMAIYLRWCMEHDLMGEDFLKEYSEVTKQVKADPANVDLREFIRDELDGCLFSVLFNQQGRAFAGYYYGEGDSPYYPADIDDYALKYFGPSRYHSNEFQQEAYLFIPFDEKYYQTMAQVIEERFENWQGQDFDEDTLEPSEVAQAIMEYLDCECTYFPSMADDDPIMSAYSYAQRLGVREGFVPVLIQADDETLLECLVMNADPEHDADCYEFDLKTVEEYRKKMLSAPVKDGKAILEELTGQRKEEAEDDDLDWEEEVLGEMEGGEPNDRFANYWNDDTGMTYPLILAKIPVKNPWEIFAYLPFGNWNECPDTPDLMAVAKYWFEQHGAIPAAMSHDELEFELPTPISKERAMEVAVEQYGFCPDLDQNEDGSIGSLADVLWQSTVWYFWWD